MSIINEEETKEENDDFSTFIIHQKDRDNSINQNDLKNCKLYKYFLLNFNSLINGNLTYNLPNNIYSYD